VFLVEKADLTFNLADISVFDNPHTGRSIKQSIG